ncbi:DUF1850 domain-containing protein [Desulfoscipio geothermicus]|uniref:DUF1850 domain-containing protein n=1 Tax=Desulfoscipio geothermicus DSM 3669 TaxID=1121426 RepID=A0A1I6DJY4_9FIRM|nr:DUF1850 domain-containing protein [Desulfoscipio geothermicus]SFR05687.1 protein of unknown function [Desulfoscipio geothermicus DSM 3669]
MKKSLMSTFTGAHYVVFFLLFVCVFIAYALHNYAFFEVKEHFSGEVLFRKPVKVGTVFTLEYVHSVTKQPVYEDYKIEDKRILSMVEMRYDSFGANLPVGPEKMAEETTGFIVEDGYYKVLYENRKFAKVPLRVGQVVADHTLVFKDGSKLRLLDVAEGGAFVEFYVRPLLSLSS